jgi:hypothetical protein
MSERLDRLNRTAQKECDAWNAKYQFPMDVTRIDDFGQPHETRTRSIAWPVCGHSVVLVDGISGGYALGRIKPKQP